MALPKSNSGTGITIYPIVPQPPRPGGAWQPGDPWNPAGFSDPEAYAAGARTRSGIVQSEVNSPGSQDPSVVTAALGLRGYQPPTIASADSTLASLLGVGRGGGMTAAEKAKAEEKAALLRWYQSGQHLAPYEGYRKNITDRAAASRGAAQGMYDRAASNIGAGYSAADQMIGTGYGAVLDYLTRNQPNAYAGFQPSALMSQAPMQNYFDAYGVSAEPVLAQVAAQNASAQQGAGGFATLVDILNRASQQAGQSRSAELELARNLGMQNLAGQRAAYESQATAALQQALAQIAQDEQDRLFEIAKVEAAAKAEGDKAIAAARPAPKTDKGNKGGKK